MKPKRILARCVCALALLVAAGCGPIAAGVWLALDDGGSGGSGAGTGTAGLTQVSAPLGPGGGTVTLGQTAVTVPPGALSTTIDLVVALGTEVAGGEYVKVGQAIRLGPAGQTFSSPVTVTLVFDPNLIPAGKSVADLILQKRNDATLAIENLTPSSVDITSNRVTVTVTSFSTLQPVILVGVDPSRSRVQASPSTVAPVTSDPSTITVTLLNPGGQPIAGRTVLLSTIGAVSTGVTITQPSQPSDANGVAQGTITSVQSGTVTVIAQVGTTVLDEQATVTFGFPVPPPPPPPGPPPPIGTLTSIVPAAGLAAGGTPVTVTGSGFDASTVVRIWGDPLVNQTVVDANTVTGQIPAPREPFQGRCNVVATTNGNAHLALPWGYHYGVTLDEVTPAASTVGGGTPITIRGGGFVPGTTFSIGGVAVPGSIVDLNTFQGTAPPGAMGAADLVVLSGADTATVGGAFYYGPPTVTAVSPSSGSLLGGCLVKLTGSGFYPGATASIGSAQLTLVEVISPSLLIGTTAANTLGVHDVQVSTPGGSDTLVGGFSCATLAVDTLSPDVIVGGLTVTLRGGGFDPTPGNNAVSFGGAAATVLAATATELTVVVPPTPVAGSVVVGVGGSFSAPVPYTLDALTLGTGSPSTSRLSGDGRYVFFSQPVSGVGTLLAFDRSSGTTEVLLPEGFASSVGYAGRYVGFWRASDLIQGDPLPTFSQPSFLFDRRTKRLVATSVDVHGRILTGSTQDTVISADGRLSVFLLNRPGPSGNLHCFLYDRDLNRSRQLNADAQGNPVPGFAVNPYVSPDGHFAYLVTNAPLVPQDTNGLTDSYRLELASWTWELVSANAAGQVGNNESAAQGWTSPDGRRVVFTSSATNLVAGDNPVVQDLFLKDMQTGAVQQVNVASDGTPANGYSTTMNPLSADGRFVAFGTQATNLGSGPGVYLRDTVAGTTVFLGNGEVKSLSADGRWLTRKPSGGSSAISLQPPPLAPG
ncbi:MAG: IPT/TIG domain-containing protein, partial [Planctomycetes bacterium]|nr:IPT/TIG domain-containing protein [Planctomycetota bacterium]